jgi:hypothetical protein
VGRGGIRFERLVVVIVVGGRPPFGSLDTWRGGGCGGRRRLVALEEDGHVDVASHAAEDVVRGVDVHVGELLQLRLPLRVEGHLIGRAVKVSGEGEG